MYVITNAINDKSGGIFEVFYFLYIAQFYIYLLTTKIVGRIKIF